MKLGRLLLAATTILTIGGQAMAQDIHFSQFYASPLNLNPAITGVMSCDMRVSAIYRNQWASVMKGRAYNTFSAGVEGKFAVGKHDYYGLGLVLWADKAGASAFSTVQAQFSASYLKRVGGRRSNEQYLVAGAQLGISQRSMKIDQLQFGTQYDGDQYNGSLPTQENIVNTRLTYADLNAGILWFGALDKKNQSNYHLGIAFSHLTRANTAFIKQGFEALYMKFTIHGGGEFRVARRFALMPNFGVFIQGPSLQSNFGLSAKFDFSKRSESSQAFQIGVFTRLVSVDKNIPNGPKGAALDAMIAVARIRFGSSSIGLSYDVNLSSLSVASRMSGGFELSYVYTLCGAGGRKLGCPYF